MRFLPLSLYRFIRPMSSASLKNESRYTSDAQPSNDSIMYQWQPANIWFKSTTLLHPNNEQDTETQVSTNEEEEEKREKMAIFNNKGLTPFSNVQASGMKKFNAIPQGHGAPKAKLMMLICLFVCLFILYEVYIELDGS